MPRTIPAVTIVDVTINEIPYIDIYRTAAGEIEASVSYEVLDDQGAQHHTGDLTKVITGPSLSSLVGWLNNHVIPEINAQEGM